MSITVAVAKSRTRFHLRDRDLSGYAFSTPELERVLEACMRELAGPSQLRMGHDWTTLAVTSATDTYSMPGSAQYGQVLTVRRDDGFTLEGPLTRETFDRWREGESSSNHPGGRPERYTLYEDSSQALKVQFSPWPDRSETLDILRSTLPAAFASDATTIPFDDLGAEALAYTAAAQLLTEADDETLAKLKLSREAAKLYFGKAAKLVADARVRRSNLRAAGRVQRVRR